MIWHKGVLKNNWLADVIIFVIIILSFHYIYLLALPYLNDLGIYNFLLVRLTDLVFSETSWFINTFLYDITTEGRTIFFEDNRFVEVSSGCSGLKPTIQFIVLLILFPGPLVKKIWFIPMGIVILHIVNLFRIVGLAITIVVFPQTWEFAHDWIFRPSFYIVIFGLWWIWNERIRLNTNMA